MNFKALLGVLAGVAVASLFIVGFELGEGKSLNERRDLDFQEMNVCFQACMTSYGMKKIEVSPISPQYDICVCNSGIRINYPEISIPEKE